MNLSTPLDPRLHLIAQFVRQGSVFADIGTDHGYLAAYLVQSGRCPRGFACDIHPLPLEKARHTIVSRHLAEQIEVRLSDGLRALWGEPIDDIVIAGMGGELIARILSDAPFIRRADIRLILQPMTKAPFLRQFLYQNGFAIQEERAVGSGRFFYTVMACHFTGQRREISPLFSLTGMLPQSIDEDGKQYLLHLIHVQQEIAAQIARSGNRSLAAQHMQTARELQQLLSSKQKG